MQQFYLLIQKFAPLERQFTQSYYLKILALMYFIGKKKVASTIRK